LPHSYGDTLFVTSSKDDGAEFAALQKAATAAAFPLRAFPMSQYPGSDHRSMAAAGIETLGVALIDGTEIDGIVKQGAATPRILTMIHTDADTISQVHPEEVTKALPVVEQTIRLLD
jgi:hypothetical protein